MAQYTILGECLICFDFLIQIAMHVVFGYKSRMGEDAPLHTFLGHSKVSNTEILKRQLFLYQQVYIKQLGLYFQSPFTSHHPFPPLNGLMILFTGFFTTLGKLLGKVVGFVVCLKLLVVGVVFLVGPLVRWILPPLKGLMILFTGFFTTLGELLGKIVVAVVVCLKLLVVAVVFVVFLVGLLVGPLVVGAVNVVFLVVKVGLFVVLQSLPATLLSNSQSEGDATCR